MNRGCYRLKFNVSTGLWVAVAECMRARGKRGRGALRRSALASAIGLALSTPVLADRSLPVAADQFIAKGIASMGVNGTHMTITQQSSSPVLLQWNSFDIAKGHSVHFDQASSSMRAVNVVMPGGPRSDINGALTASGQIFLFNQAGILFGESARVDVGGLVASTLKLNDKLIEAALNSLGSTEAAFSKFAEGGYAGRATGDLTVARGARLIAAKNGRVLLAAPNVNVGSEVTLEPGLTPAEQAALPDAHIAAEEGQIILAAGEKVYVADPLDSRLRGFLVEVDNGGKVTTESASDLLSQRGNITLVGLNIRHGGAARTTTSVTLNGTVFLKARHGATALGRDDMFPDAEPLGAGETVMVGQNSGRIELAAGSLIEITPDEATAQQTARDDMLFRRSEVNLYGREIIIEDAADAASGAAIHAPSGLLRITSAYGSSGVPGTGPIARTYIGRHADIDLSGVDAFADADREMLQVELRGTETAGSPLLNDEKYGRHLFGKTIWVDGRTGTELADISGYMGSVERTVAEKSASGGDLVMNSLGTVLTHADSVIDLSGGTVTYRAGEVGYSVLRSADGRHQTVESARADRVYTGVIDGTRSVAERLEGRDAGSISVTAQSAAIDGRIDAARTVGMDQRQLTTRWVGPGVSQTLGVPQAGRFSLELTKTAGLQDLRFVSGAEMGRERTLSADMAAPQEILIRDDLFSGGVGRFSVTGVGRVTLPQDVHVDVTAGALHAQVPAQLSENEIRRLDAAKVLSTVQYRQSVPGRWTDGSLFDIRATSFAIDGSLRAAGGVVSLATSVADPSVGAAGRSIVLGEHARVSTAGEWIQDSTPRAGGHLAIDGGRITFDAKGDVTVARGARIDASAGAWRNARGAVALGDAGRIDLLAGAAIDSASGVAGELGAYYGTLALDGMVTAYGVARGGAAGGSGSLALRSARIAIDGGATGVDADGTLRLGLDLFSDYGFSAFTIDGGNGVTVGHADGRTLLLEPAVLTRRLDSLPRAARPSLEGAGVLSALDRARRDDAISLAFHALSNVRGEVTVHEGAKVAVDAGGDITLTGNRSVVVAGHLMAPGGRITLDQEEAGAGTNRDFELGDSYRGASIFLAPTARLDASGTFLRTPDLRHAEGSVFDGGDIRVAARRGYLIAQDGALLQADGASEVLLQPVGSGRADVRIDSDGGNIVLDAREGLYVEASLSAKAGGASASGGALTVELVQGANPWVEAQQEPAFSRPRQLEVVQDGSSGAADFQPGAAVAAARSGRGVFVLSSLQNSGIVDLELGAVDSNSYGALVFTSDVEAAVAGRLTLNSANLLGRNGADVTLGGSVVEWRNDGHTQRHHAQATSLSAGDGALTLAGDLLTVSGNLAASGFSTVDLNARGDLRASAGSGYFLEGSTLATSGDLTLTAAQVYPTSASKYAFEVQNNAAGTLTVRHSGAAAGPVYSALGELTLAAPNVVQDGRVVAPLGQVNLLSQTITRSNGVMSSATRGAAPGGKVELTAGSVTSVSADGLLIPFGQTTLSGKEWIYLMPDGTRIEVGNTPEKAVTLNADRVIVADAAGDKDAARIDLSGGGDIQGWEWIPGSGGPTDILSKAETEGAYAIVPAIGSGHAPFDASIYGEDANGLKIGQSITLLADANGLKAGTYTLLPARYALLPGAYLVRVNPGDQSIGAGRSVAQADGTVRVSAREARVIGGDIAGGGKSFVAELLTQVQVRSRAEYLLSTTGDVFDDGRSTQDAGRLSLQVGRELQLAGVLDTTHEASARGARLDLTAHRLALLGEGAQAQAGEVGVSVAALNALDAESIVLGGTRGGIDAATGATMLDTRDTDAQGHAIYGAVSVRLDNANGPALQAPDLVLVARDQVTIEADSRITAAGKTEPEILRVTGSGATADGAMLRVSGSEDAAAPLRDAPLGARGTLVLGAGAEITGNAVVLDSTLVTVNNGAQILLPESGGALALTGASISVGEVPAGTGGLVFDTAALAGLGKPGRLTLKSYGGLNLYGDVTLGSADLDLLRIDTAGIVGHDNAGLTQRIVATEVQFASSALNPSLPAAPGGAGGALEIGASTVVFDATSASGTGGGASTGEFAVRGFDTVQVNAAQGVQLAGTGHYDIAASDVTLNTPRISAGAGADIGIEVSGALTMRGTGGQVGQDGAVGGAFTAVAREIGVHTLLDLPSGRVSLTANGSDAASGSLTVGTLHAADGTVLGEGRIIAAGTQKDYLGKMVATPGGTVALSSEGGDVRLTDGARVDVSAAANGFAGTVALSAPRGTVSVADGALKATASAPELGGEFSVDLHTAAALDALAAVSGDFTRRWAARVREGDTRLDRQVEAREIVIGADAGSLTIGGRLDASGTDRGGRIELAARRSAAYAAGDAAGAGDVVLAAGAVLDARATTAVSRAEGTQGEGGTVSISAAARNASGSAGTVRIAEGARIEVGTPDGSVAREGEVTVRATRGGPNGIAIDGNIGAAVNGARHVFIEGSQVHEFAGGTTVNLSAAHAAAGAFMTAANVASMRAALGLPAAADGVYHIRPHIELRSDGDLAMSATDLATYTYLGGSEAGALTVRAGGTLKINGTLSDGFGRGRSGALTNVLGALESSGVVNGHHFNLGGRDTAWSIQLASGADTSAAQSLALQSLSVLDAGGKGDLVIAANAQVRTGAGGIEVAAGRDLRLEGAKSAIYTAGYQDTPGTPFEVPTQLNVAGSGNRRAAYGHDGGNVSVTAQRDISAQQSDLTVGDWLLRHGSLAVDGTLIGGTASSMRNPTWYARTDLFGSGIATFGGGNVSVRAGGDVDNLTVVAVSNGRLFGDGGTTPDLTNLKVQGGGDVAVSAGGDIGSATFVVDRGVLQANAGGALDSARSNGRGSVLVLGDASASLRATGDVLLETIASTTLLQQTSASRSGSRESYVVSYGAGNGVAVASLGGSVALNNTLQPWGDENLLLSTAVLPPSLSLVAMGGDLDIGGSMVLVPSTRNDVLLAASGTVNLGKTGGAQIRVSDMDPGLVPSVAAPAVNVNDVRYAALINFGLVSGRSAHDERLNSARDVVPVRVIAEQGDIKVPFNASSMLLSLYSPQPVLVEAGGDVSNLTLRSQHYSPEDITRVRAGGDIRFDAIVNARGTPSTGVREGIIVGGQGKVDVLAGGNVDLANSIGIVTRGNYDNPALPEKGASIRVQAGSTDFSSEELLALLGPVAEGVAGNVFDSAILQLAGATDLDAVLAQEGNAEIRALRSAERARIAGLLDQVDARIVAWMRGQPGHEGMTDASLKVAFAQLPDVMKSRFYAANQPLLSGLLNAGLRYAGQLGDLLGSGVEGYAPGYALIDAAFGKEGTPADINVFYSQIKSEQGGGLDLYATRDITVGVAGAGASLADPARQGLFAIGEGEINAIAGRNFQLGPSRVFTLGGDDVQIWASRGDIDAGKGSSTASATPPPQVVIRGDQVVLDLSASVSGSGIGTLKKSEDVADADIRLFAPAGAVIAADAGIRSSGDVRIGADRVIGDNIRAGGTVGGSATAVAAAPAAPSVAPPPNEANKAADAGQSATAADGQGEKARNSILTVELVGLGEDAAAPHCQDEDDEVCKKTGDRRVN
jgi:filamentous hemagglutinin family protein